jgi:hypothetical protein
MEQGNIGKMTKVKPMGAEALFLSQAAEILEETPP